MHVFFLLVRIYPYWSVPCIIVSLEMAVFYQRRKSKLQLFFWVFSLISISLLLIWVINRGDLYAGRWIRAMMNYLHVD